MINEAQRARKIEDFKTAVTLVDPIIQEHGLQDQEGSKNIFMTQGVSFSKVDQHVDHVIRVADWLGEED